MAKGSPEADSSASVNTPVTGKNLVQLATEAYGSKPVFWGRYFTSISATGTVEYRHLKENRLLRENKNAFAECWVRSVKQECLRKLVLFGQGSLRRALTEYIVHFHKERNDQGKNNLLLFSSPETVLAKSRVVQRTERFRRIA